uniref:Transcription termination factor 4, mitochondrial n=1 Tax=Cacopsylla melanoneura TaxID=428564 RepID=A0A8D9E9X2_9HEMI
MSKLFSLLRLVNSTNFHLRFARKPTLLLHHQSYSVSVRTNCQLINNHLNLLTEYNFHKPSIQEMLNGNPVWNEISPTELKNTIEVLQSYKFSVNDITDVFKSAADVCTIEKNDLIDTLETWLTVQFNLDSLIDLLSSQPILLKIDKEEIVERIPTYLLVFNNNRSKLVLFLKVCPEVMYENFKDIVEKYNYIRHKMEIKPKELLNSRVLTGDLNFIKTRHMFLDRSGQYNYRTKDMSPIMSLGNPTLNSIFDTSDKMFAEKIAKLSLLEYETFCSYFAQELAEEDDESDLSEEEE